MTAIGDILGLAVGIALSPVQVIAAIAILFTPRARTNGPAFAIGWTLSLFAVSVLLVALFGAADVSSDEDSSDVLNALKVLVGLLFVAGAAQQWSKYRKSGDEPELPAWMGALDTFTPVRAFGLGALSAAANPKVLALTFSAAVTIGQAGLGRADEWVAIAVFVGVSSVSVIAPVVYYMAARESATDALSHLRDWLTVHQAAVIAVVFLVIGAVVLGQGLAGLSA
jgi:hypothetical protein